jgi:hypothetical protein
MQRALYTFRDRAAALGLCEAHYEPLPIEVGESRHA